MNIRPSQSRSRRFIPASVCISAHLCLILFSSSTQAAWFDAAWQYRRPIEVTWDAEHASGQELATVEFYTDGHALPNGEDIRIATDEGKLVASHLLMEGPGDRMRLVFSLQKGIKKYAVYFGNPRPEPPPKGLEDVTYKAGLMMETKVWTGGAVNDFDSIESSWQRSQPLLGRTMIPMAFMGYNPFGPQQQWISKIVGSLYAPFDGQYQFAMSVDDEGALYLDGKPVLLAHIGPGDIRYNATVGLKRGPHEFLLYHVNVAGEGRFTVGWRRPDSGKFDVIGRETFGTCFGTQVGAMEERNKTLLADFSVKQAGECFFAGRYSFRCRFASQAKAIAGIKYEWDFGDGQSATQPEADHVYLNDGVYPVRLTARVGPNSDTQTSRVIVDRDWEKILNSPQDEPAALSKIVADYALTSIPIADLPRAASLHLRAGNLDAASLAANRLAEQKKAPDVNAATECLLAVDRALLDAGRVAEAAAMWDRPPVDANIQPMAAKRAAQVAMWWTGDFEKAVKALQPFHERKDESIQRLYGQALILAGNAKEGKKILTELPPQGPVDREAALSGASARSIEFFIAQGDAESGEDAWERWQTKYPAEFLEGYGVLLRVKLMVLRKQPLAAAKAAEAFATGAPMSSYSPQLLYTASKLIEGSDASHGKALRAMLKEKYPEDPLSQE